MKSTESTIAVIPDLQAARTAVKRPAQSGFERMNLSVLGGGYHSEEEVGGFYNSGDRIRLWAPRARSLATTAAFSQPPRKALRMPEVAVKADDFLVLARGSAAEMARTRRSFIATPHALTYVTARKSQSERTNLPM
jgi:hypothetical protein